MLQGTQKPVMQRTAMSEYAFYKDCPGKSLADGSKNWAAGMKTDRLREKIRTEPELEQSS